MERSKLSRRGFLKLSLGVAVAQFVAACGPGATKAPEPATEVKVEATQPRAPTAKPQPVTLRVSTFIDPAKDCARCQSLKQITDNFRQANASVDVSFEISPWDQVSTKFMTAYVAGNEPDISWCEIQYTPEVMKQGSAEDLGQWIFSKWTEEDRQEFPQALWEVGLDGQKKYFLTTYHMTDGLVYRKDLFAEAGIDAPSLKTWDSMIQAL
ncbi:MAG: substrate-binding domain-containing protein, partial [Anaerolineae bacterium]|nr:substrate-binding domain-containing protein [Anaerolineae bacterium]